MERSKTRDAWRSPFALLLASQPALAETQLPPDVLSFMDKRQGCDHFRVEPWDPGDDPEIKERREFILRNIEALCTGIDRELAELQEKYLEYPSVTARLRQFEPQVERP